MTDKIYGGYRPATIGTATQPDYVYPSGERLEGVRDSKPLPPNRRADESPIEDVLNRTNLTIDRLEQLSIRLYCRLEPYMKQSQPEVASDKVGYPPPSSSLGQAIYSLEERLRGLEYQLEELYSRVER